MRKFMKFVPAVLTTLLCFAGCAQAPAAPSASSAPAQSAAAADHTASPAEHSSAPAESSAPAQSSDAAQALSGSVQMSGSTSMETIANALAEGFMELYPDVTVDVQLGGSSVGVQDAQSGKSDIGNVSRQLKAEETGLVPNTVAIDGIAVIVNPANKVTDLTKDDLIKIYKGEISNWKDVGGDDQPIVVIGREASSGTRGAFEELLKIEEACKYAQELNETGAVKTMVSTTPAAIGYVSLEALDDSVVALNIDGAPATEESIKSGNYALSRPFIMAVKEGDLKPQVAAFLEFVLGPDGQAIVSDNKLISVN